MSPSATVPSVTDIVDPLKTKARQVASSISDNEPARSQAFQLFPEAELARYRASVPALSLNSITHVNSGYQGLMTLGVKQALDLYLVQAISNPAPKAIWQAQAKNAHEALAKHLSVSSDDVVFTRDTTEGLNLFQRSLKLESGDNVVVLEGEHPHNVYGWLSLAESIPGLQVRRVPDSDALDFADASTFKPYVDEHTRCVSISSVMFHSGQMNDVGDICQKFRSRGIHVLADLTQHIGTAPIDLLKLNVSAAAFGVHKALACPTGLGALYVNPEVLADLRLSPPVAGAGAIANLEGTLIAKEEVTYHPTAQRYAHLNISLMSAVALEASLALVDGQIGIARLESHLRALGRELLQRLDAINVSVMGSDLAKRRSPHIYIVQLMHPDWQEHFLAESVYVTHYRCGVRVSFGSYNSVRDVESFVASVKRGLAKGIPRE